MGNVRIGIIGGKAVWRRGIGAVLAEAGYSPVEYAVADDWRPSRGRAAALIHVENAAGLEALAYLHDEHPELPIVVSVPTLGVAEFAAVVKAGALGAFDEEESIDAVIAVVQHALAGRASAPRQIAQALAARIGAGFGEALQVSDDDANRLRALARGTTVAKLAFDSGYSEREMFRLLNELYMRLGATNRTEAILWAERYGLLDGASDD